VFVRSNSGVHFRPKEAESQMQTAGAEAAVTAAGGADGQTGAAKVQAGAGAAHCATTVSWWFCSLSTGRLCIKLRHQLD